MFPRTLRFKLIRYCTIRSRLIQLLVYGKDWFCIGIKNTYAADEFNSFTSFHKGFIKSNEWKNHFATARLILPAQCKKLLHQFVFNASNQDLILKQKCEHGNKGKISKEPILILVQYCI